MCFLCICLSIVCIYVPHSLLKQWDTNSRMLIVLSVSSYAYKQIKATTYEYIASQTAETLCRIIFMGNQCARLHTCFAIIL